jgi:hypothetical protein
MAEEAVVAGSLGWLYAKVLPERHSMQEVKLAPVRGRRARIAGCSWSRGARGAALGL